MRKFIKLIFISVIIFSCKNEIKEITEKYPNGSAKVVTFYKEINGSKIKIREIGYYQNGNESYKGGFNNGTKSGLWQYWYENKNLFAQTEFNGNIQNQKWKIYKPDNNLYMPDSYKLTVSEIYTNGSPYHASYQKDNDRLIYEIFFYPSYKIQMHGTTVNNIRQGKWTYWYENGHIWSEGFFKGGENDSIRNVWYENGKKRYEGFYNKGKEAGKWKFYDENGLFIKEKDYNTNNKFSVKK